MLPSLARELPRDGKAAQLPSCHPVVRGKTAPASFVIGKPRLPSAKALALTRLRHCLRVHPRTLCRLLKRREIPRAFVGRSWRVNLTGLMAHALKTNAKAGKK